MWIIPTADVCYVSALCYRHCGADGLIVRSEEKALKHVQSVNEAAKQK